MAKQTGEQIVQDRTTEALVRSGEAANEMIKGNVDALTETGNASRAAVQELTKAYQELTTKNVRNLTAAMQALAGVKSPAEYIELQQRLDQGRGRNHCRRYQTHGPIDNRRVHCGFRAGNETHPGRAERRAPLSRRFFNPAGSSCRWGCIRLSADAALVPLV